MSRAVQLARQRQKLQAKVTEEKKVYPTFDLREFLFTEQLAFVQDEARFSVACCSVRAGKTTACAADLINTALHMPGTLSLYITLARTSAKAIAWPELKRINRDYGLHGDPNESDLTMHFPNGSWIRLYGGNEESEIEKIRGLSNVALVYLDEVQAFRPHIKQLVEDIVTKRLYDTNGRCRLIGTPGPIEAGYFFECTASAEWSRHHWTMFNNPWLLKKSGKTPQELTDADCRRKGVTIDDPAIQRENYGRWKQDPNALLLNYERARNDYDLLPAGNWTYLLGIDLGQRDYNFLSVLGFTDRSRETYLIEEKFTANQLTDNLALDIKALMAKYAFAKMLIDTGGLGLAIAEDLKFRYGLPLEAADKREKMATYAIMNNALRNGTFKARASSLFAKDCNLLERDDLKSTPDRLVVKGHSDAVDACLYPFKYSPAYNYVPSAPSPKPGTPEYDKKVAEDLFNHHLQKLKDAQAMKDGQAMTWKVDQNAVPTWNQWND